VHLTLVSWHLVSLLLGVHTHMCMHGTITCCLRSSIHTTLLNIHTTFKATLISTKVTRGVLSARVVVVLARLARAYAHTSSADSSAASTTAPQWHRWGASSDKSSNSAAETRLATTELSEASSDTSETSSP